MPSSRDILKERLFRYLQIKISIIGRKSGQTISIPVWFVLEGEKLCLLPVRGSDTQWYRNVLMNPQIRIDARCAETELRFIPITDNKAASSVIEKFRELYGAKDVKKYYSKFVENIPLQAERYSRRRQKLFAFPMGIGVRLQPDSPLTAFRAASTRIPIVISKSSTAWPSPT